MSSHHRVAYLMGSVAVLLALGGEAQAQSSGCGTITPSNVERCTRGPIGTVAPAAPAINPFNEGAGLLGALFSGLSDLIGNGSSSTAPASQPSGPQTAATAPTETPKSERPGPIGETPVGGKDKDGPHGGRDGHHGGKDGHHGGKGGKEGGEGHAHGGKGKDGGHGHGSFGGDKVGEGHGGKSGGKDGPGSPARSFILFA